MPISGITENESSFAPAAGIRVNWPELPKHVRAAIESRLGSPVVEARTQPGGFSPGLAARLRLADGRRVFLKAVSGVANPDSPAIHRREARIAAALPPPAPAPRFLGCYDDAGWTALLFEDIEGTPPTMPWQRHELKRVLEAVTALSSALTPAPIDVERLPEVSPDLFLGWERLAEAAASGKDDLDGLDRWVRRHLDELVELASDAPHAAEGSTLAHADVRADNIVLTTERVYFVDWPWASRAAPWIDLLCMLPSVAMQRGPKPWEIFEQHPVGKSAPPERATCVLAALSGFFLRQSRQPPPPGLPTLRRFQAEQAVEALAWLRQRTGWS